MPIFMNCERWLEDLGTPSSDTVYGLLNTLLNGEGCGEFECSIKDTLYFIRKVNSDGWLILPSGVARADLLDLLKAKYRVGDDIKTWYKNAGGSMPRTS